MIDAIDLDAYIDYPEVRIRHAHAKKGAGWVSAEGEWVPTTPSFITLSLNQLILKDIHRFHRIILLRVVVAVIEEDQSTYFRMGLRC